MMSLLDFILGTLRFIGQLFFVITLLPIPIAIIVLLFYLLKKAICKLADLLFTIPPI